MDGNENRDDGSQELRVIDSSKYLTLDELKELKKLASLSKISSAIIAILFSIITVTGIQFIGEWILKIKNVR
ncbi:MAG: hypothetical protein WC856_08000 [Methylococcaceae bacterium]|jgi:hypothetical protein